MGLRQSVRPTKPVASTQVEEDGGVAAVMDDVPLDQTDKSFSQRVTPVIACGAGLFSDGYLNGVCILATYTTRGDLTLAGHRLCEHYSQDPVQAGVFC
jgi:hypothetical protein